MRNACLLTLFVFFCCFGVKAQPIQAEHIKSAYEEIVKYEVVSPQLSFKLIEKYQSHVHLLPLKAQFDWHHTSLMVANELDDLNLTATALQNLANLPGEAGMKDNQLSYLTHLGHYFNKTAHYNHAITAYLCAIERTKEINTALPMIYSIAIAFVLSENITKGREILLLLSDYLVITNAPQWRGLVFEALGLLALRTGAYYQAAQFFTDAMDTQQSNANVGRELNSMMNLLLTFALNNNFDKFHRLESRAIRLNSLFKNKDLHIYLEWIQALQEHQQHGELVTYNTQMLLQRYHQIQTQPTKEAIQNHIADELGIELPAEPIQHNHPPELPHLDHLLKNHHCKKNSNPGQFLTNYLKQLEVD